MYYIQILSGGLSESRAWSEKKWQMVFKKKMKTKLISYNLVLPVSWFYVRFLFHGVYISMVKFVRKEK